MATKSLANVYTADKSKVASFMEYRDKVCYPPTLRPKNDHLTDVIKNPPCVVRCKDIHDWMKRFAAPKREITVCFYCDIHAGGRQFFGRILGLTDHHAHLTATDVMLQPAMQFDSITGIILAHSHKRTPKPTQKDIQDTKRIELACSEVGVHLVDHTIFTKNGYFSFFENKMLQWRGTKKEG